VSEGLAGLTRDVTPGDVVSVNSVRKAMGIDPNGPPSTEEPDTADESQPSEKADDNPPRSASQSVAATEDDEDEDSDSDDDDDDDEDDDESGDEPMEEGTS